MSIIIQGIEMPPERQCLHIIIKYNGIVCDALSGEDVATAYELPPHGRLIDADELSKHIVYMPMDGGYLPVVYASYLTSSPTIIEADMGAE